MNAQRRLGQSTQSIQQSYTRLSSGLRINKASDDAAGLAIAGSLNTDADVYAQAVRNINDGISLLNIAEGAMQELTGITIRQRELSTQAANGTLSNKQREALDEEAAALTAEFARIAAKTEFNGIKLLDGSESELSVQAGYGGLGTITLDLGVMNGATSRGVGTGTFNSATTVAAGGFLGNVAAADFNGDGVLDLAMTNMTTDQMGVMLGKGDGSFYPQTVQSTADNPRYLAVGDLNGDGKQDIVTTDNFANQASVFLGKGDGTFQNRIGVAIPDGGSGAYGVSLSDLNGDNVLDMVYAKYSRSSVGVRLGKGDGTFLGETRRLSDGSRSRRCKWGWEGRHCDSRQLRGQRAFRRGRRFLCLKRHLFDRKLRNIRRACGPEQRQHLGYGKHLTFE